MSIRGVLCTASLLIATGGGAPASDQLAAARLMAAPMMARPGYLQAGHRPGLRYELHPRHRSGPDAGAERF
jgi:hypothetical protein